MADDLIATMKRIATDYRRGSCTHAEFVDALFRELVDHDASDEIVDQVFLLIPDSAFPALEDRMHEIVENDFFVPTTQLGDARSEDQIYRDAYARQPIFKRVHHALIRPVLKRRVRLHHGC
ncbi:hypothetical protein [Novipirellula rosea]|uniref:Uncharacterized protein n=1 Tax=Novipirellula rosea TaxID=1031540 RepID=A0ABP8NT00_9BACT